MTATMPSLDGRRFRMRSSTTSHVNPDAPSVFDYHERDGVVWGEYVGDTVSFGRFVGTRVDDTIAVTFVHVQVAAGAVVTGTAESTIEQDAAGLRLVERYEMHGSPQLSICVEDVA